MLTRVLVLANILMLLGGCALSPLEQVNVAANKITYVSDKDNYGVTDYWAYPDEFKARGGDCEDYAIYKLDTIRRNGIASLDQMSIVLVHMRVTGEGHAFLKVGDYYLDNRYDLVTTHFNHVEYKYIVSIGGHDVNKIIRTKRP